MSLYLKIISAGIAGLLVIPLIIGFTSMQSQQDMSMKHSAMKNTTEYNKEVGTEIEEGIANLIAEGRYKCCLEKPCSYCFAKQDKHDKELVCDCLEDIMNGKHPCGECIGEILEGEGHPLIAEYFATSLAEEIGEGYLEILQTIMFEKYGMPVTQQL